MQLPFCFLLQYRFSRSSCVHRLFNEANATQFHDIWTYAIETGLHEQLLQSTHRTLDPEEADFFYVPVYIGCLAWPVLGSLQLSWMLHLSLCFCCQAPGPPPIPSRAEKSVLTGKHPIVQVLPMFLTSMVVWWAAVQARWSTWCLRHGSG